MTVERVDDRAPWPLLVAAVLAVGEGLTLVGYAVAVLVSVSSHRLTMGLTTTAFLAAYGGFLAFCGVRLAGRHSWARSPIVLSQLIQLGVAWGFAGGVTTWVAVVLAVVAVVALVGVFHPASLAALSETDELDEGA